MSNKNSFSNSDMLVLPEPSHKYQKMCPQHALLLGQQCLLFQEQILQHS